MSLYTFLVSIGNFIFAHRIPIIVNSNFQIHIVYFVIKHQLEYIFSDIILIIMYFTIDRHIFTGDWSLPVKEAEATNSMADQGVDVFTMHVDGPKVVVETAAKRGKMVCGYHASQAKLAPNAYLTGAEWNWLTAYKTIIEAAQSGKPHPNFLRGGLKEGYVKTSPYGAMVTDAAKKNADDIKAKMIAGTFDIFKGPLKDNKGNTVIAAGKSFKQTDIELEKMNYLVEGVIGSI